MNVTAVFLHTDSNYWTLAEINENTVEQIKICIKNFCV